MSNHARYNHNDECNDRYVVVDLETTAPEARQYSVGIVVIESGEGTDRYAADVNPHEPLVLISKKN